MPLFLSLCLNHLKDNLEERAKEGMPFKLCPSFLLPVHSQRCATKELP